MSLVSISHPPEAVKNRKKVQDKLIFFQVATVTNWYISNDSSVYVSYD